MQARRTEGYWNTQLEREGNIESRQAKRLFKHRMAVITGQSIMEKIGIAETTSPDLSEVEADYYKRQERRVSQSVELGLLADGLYVVSPGEVHFEETKYFTDNPSWRSRLGLVQSVEPAYEGMRIIHSDWDEDEYGDARNPWINVKDPFDRNAGVDRFCIWLEEIAQTHGYPLPFFGRTALSG